MTAYISVSFSKRKYLDKEISLIGETLHRFNIEPFVFVDHFTFESTQEREMMQQAMIEIDRCDLLIAETSEKGIGIGVEAGYAKGKGKPLIYLRQKDVEHSTTVSGMSDFQIIYSDLKDLQKQLESIMRTFIKEDSDQTFKLF